MPILVVQPKQGSATTGSAPTCALATTVTGNTLVVIVMAYNAAANLTVSSISLSTGAGTFAKIGSQAGIGGSYPPIEAWVAPNITGGTTPTLTVHLSGATTGADVYVFELSGMPATATQDGTAAGAASAAATACVTPNITTTNAGSIVFGAFSPLSSMSTGGWTGYLKSITTGSLAEFQVQTATQASLHATATQASSGIYGSLICALQPVSAVTTLHFAMAIADTSTVVALGLEVNRHFPVAIADTSTVIALGWHTGQRVQVQIADTSTVQISWHTGQRFQVAIADTSTVVTLGFRVGQRFQVTIADTSTVLTLGYRVSEHFPLAIADTSTVVALGFRVGQRLGVQIADTSTVVALGFALSGAGVVLRFSLSIADSTLVHLSWSLPVQHFPVAISDNSTVWISFSNDHFQAIHPSLIVPPYAGDPQDPTIDVPRWIQYKEDQWEDGPWAMPPYEWIFPHPAPVAVPERGTDAVHAAWLTTHRRSPRPRRLGDNNHRPQSVLAPYVPTPPIMKRPVWVPVVRRLKEPLPPIPREPDPVPPGVPIQSVEKEEGPWVMPPYAEIYPQPKE